MSTPPGREQETAAEPRAPEERREYRRDLDRSQALVELSRTLAESITDIGRVVVAVAELVANFLNDTVVLRLLVDDGERLKAVAMHDRDPVIRERMEVVLRSSSIELSELEPYARALDHNTPVVLSGNQAKAALTGLSEEAAAALASLDVGTLLICPMRAHGQVIGSLSLWRREDRSPHSERDQRFAQELADRAALAVENARLVDRLRNEIEARAQREDDLRLTTELLKRADEKRRVLMDHLVQAQEEERRRIAIDVHDDSIQAMAAIGVRLQLLRRHAHDQDATKRIAEIEDTVTETIGRLRDLIFQLETGSVEKVGLAQALSQFADQCFPEGQPVAAVKSSVKVEPQGPLQIILYRIAQEALINVRKHARANEVRVTIKQADGGYLLEVHDDGVGFDTVAVAERSLPGHLGMRGMRQRAEVAGGWLELKSARGKGTTLRCWVAGDRDWAAAADERL